MVNVVKAMIRVAFCDPTFKIHYSHLPLYLINTLTFQSTSKENATFNSSYLHQENISLSLTCINMSSIQAMDSPALLTLMELPYVLPSPAHYLLPPLLPLFPY